MLSRVRAKMQLRQRSDVIGFRPGVKISEEEGKECVGVATVVDFLEGLRMFVYEWVDFWRESATRAGRRKSWKIRVLGAFCKDKWVPEMLLPVWKIHGFHYESLDKCDGGCNQRALVYWYRPFFHEMLLRPLKKIGFVRDRNRFLWRRKGALIAKWTNLMRRKYQLWELNFGSHLYLTYPNSRSVSALKKSEVDLTFWM